MPASFRLSISKSRPPILFLLQPRPSLTRVPTSHSARRRAWHTLRSSPAPVGAAGANKTLHNNLKDLARGSGTEFIFTGAIFRIYRDSENTLHWNCQFRNCVLSGQSGCASHYMLLSGKVPYYSNGPSNSSIFTRYVQTASFSLRPTICHCPLLSSLSTQALFS